MRHHRQEKDPSVSLKLANMMRTLVDRGYIPELVLLALTSLFSVPKGTEDMCMVLDATLIGNNYYLWDPNFEFPSIISVLMMLGTKMHMFYLDVG